MATRELITRDEVAERIRVTPDTITKWRRRGLIPYIRINVTTYRFDFNEVVAALRDKSKREAEERRSHVEITDLA